MTGRLSRLVRQRASGRCEYCHLPEPASSIPFEVDHIIAQKHGGGTFAGNLALACFYCNSHKGANIAGFDPLSRKLTRLFHPRRRSWAWHFRTAGGAIQGRTAIGRTTARVLNFNVESMLILRTSLIEEGIRFD